MPGPLSWVIAIVAIALGVYYFFPKNQGSSSSSKNNNNSSASARNATKPNRKFLDFDEDCKIRELQESDLNDLKRLVAAKGGCGYFKDHSLLPYLSNSKLFLSFGVEHKSSKKIICTQFISMTDNEETGYCLGAMIDKDFIDQSRIIYMRLSQSVQNECCLKFNKLRYHRTIKIKNNLSYLNSEILDVYTKFNVEPFKNTTDCEYYLHSIKAESDKNKDENQDNYKECTDGDKIINLLNEYKINDVLIDWKLYQVVHLKKYLHEEIKNNNLSVMVADDNNSMCIVYAANDYYVYCKDIDNSLKCIKHIIATKSNNDFAIGIFINKSFVDNNDQLNTLLNTNSKNEVIGLNYDIQMDGH